MFGRAPETIERFDEQLDPAPDSAAVFLVRVRDGPPYLARTAVLRRRLRRLLGERDRPGRLLNLRQIAERVDYWRVGSALEAALGLHELARVHFPDSYSRLLKLRMPAYVKLILSNPFPRTQVTSRLGGADSIHVGPFRTRTSAEEFESRVLDLYQLRRCQEDLDPSPAHPGCMYGEMNMCLRPCQQAVTSEEYRSEAVRVAEFLFSRGNSLVAAIESARDRLSEEMNFEEAASLHRRLEKVREVTKLSGDLARDVDRLYGVAVTPSAAPASVELFFVLAGWFAPPRRLAFEVRDGKPVSLDRQIREIAAAPPPRRRTRSERQEHLALLSRWFHSSWRDGEWVAFDRPESLPCRRIVNAVHRVATA